MTREKLTKTFLECAEEVRDFVDEAMMNQRLGKVGKSDGTFRLGSRLMGKKLILYVVMGDRGKIVTYGMVEREAWDEVELLLQRLGMRCTLNG